MLGEAACLLCDFLCSKLSGECREVSVALHSMYVSLQPLLSAKVCVLLDCIQMCHACRDPERAQR